MLLRKERGGNQEGTLSRRERVRVSERKREKERKREAKERVERTGEKGGTTTEGVAD